MGPSQKYGLNGAPRNDEIKEIFDIPAALLCAEFYKKHYGLGFDNEESNLNVGLYVWLFRSQWVDLEFKQLRLKRF